ncbi:flagellar hook-length control protein FliK [Roseateles sp. YR242]|uniref:flagellar hook-length control protein FliK n=1 Tax=Roseateles sp. YR242 TaxID=1855305 RepID=UPI000B85C10E|nr:flagellar hook-length control protein FliK [Roseateles sp. YR242]
MGADANVDAAAELVGSWVTEAAAVPSAGQGVLELEFSVDSLRLGPLQGRVSISGGRADVELQASRPATASALRARQLQLQHLVRRESGGDVELRLL